MRLYKNIQQSRNLHSSDPILISYIYIYIFYTQRFPNHIYSLSRLKLLSVILELWYLTVFINDQKFGIKTKKIKFLIIIIKKKKNSRFEWQLLNRYRRSHGEPRWKLFWEYSKVWEMWKISRENHTFLFRRNFPK